MAGYRVFISRKHLDESGAPTGEVDIAQELYDHLTSLGIETFLDDVSLIQQGTGRYKQAIDDALDEATVLVAVGTTRRNLDSQWVRYEWDSFFNDVISGVKPSGQVISLISGLKPAELPRALRQSQAFEYEADGIKQLGELLVNALGIGRPRRFDKPTVMDTTVLFMDVTGSTQLYGQHGDEIAERIIGKAMRDWKKITEQHGGWVVKHLGDEMMCGFDEPDACARAALEIREEIAIGVSGESIAIRVKMGFSSGDAKLMPDGDMMGEAVNLAARMTGLARGDNIITSYQTMQRLAPELREKCKHLGDTSVKWRDIPIAFYEIR